MGIILLKERAKWAINYVANKDGRWKLSNIKLGEQMGLSTGTINSYRRMITEPNIEFVNKFCEDFSFDKMWFFEGSGEPFPGARLKHPEICGPEKDRPLYNKEEPRGIYPAETGVEYGGGMDLKDKLIRSLEKLITHLEKERNDLKTRLEAIEKKAM